MRSTIACPLLLMIVFASALALSHEAALAQSLLWRDNFDDADISDWSIENPYRAGDNPVTIEPNGTHWVSPNYSLKVSSPQANGYSGKAVGPDLPIDITQPFRIEFSFRYGSFHWYHLVRFGPVALTLDYASIKLRYHANGTWGYLGSQSFGAYCPANHWARFRIEVDPPSGDYSVYIDDVFVGTVNYGTHDTGYRGFQILETSGGNVDFLNEGYYDDLEIVGTLVWKERFDYGDMTGWNVTNPYRAEDNPVTLETSGSEWVSPGYSLKVSSPQANGYSGRAIGPDLPIDITQPFRVEFSFRYGSFHWYHLVRFGPIALTMDYASIRLRYHANGVWGYLGSQSFGSLCSPNHWAQFRIEVNPNPPNGTYSVYIDDVLAGTVNYGTHDTGYRGFHLLETSGGNVDYLQNGYYDNLLIAGQEWLPTDAFGGDDGVQSVPKHVVLLPNTPNPFNPITTIRFDLPRDSDVTLRIFDVGGSLVRTLVDQRLGAKRHAVEWNGVDEHGRHAPSGVYVYRLETSGVIASRTMVLLK